MKSEEDIIKKAAEEYFNEHLEEQRKLVSSKPFPLNEIVSRFFWISRREFV
jgi:hypothetical protein